MTIFSPDVGKVFVSMTKFSIAYTGAGSGLHDF
jgi:hypothetical protein